jgi:DNA-binding MarR family transcriptional regulator
METTCERLKLDKQLCYPLYAASRLITKCYQPMLGELGLTYPQYLVLLVLWENDNVSLGTIAERLQLQSNTLTPLLKRMQHLGLLTRNRSQEDERSVIISLTEEGKILRNRAVTIPEQLDNSLKITTEEYMQLHTLLYKLLSSHEQGPNHLSKRGKE